MKTIDKTPALTLHLYSNIKKIEVVYGSLAEGQNTVLSSKAENEAVIQDLFASVEVIQQTFDAVLSWRDQSRQLYQKGRVLSSLLLPGLFTLFSVTGYCLGSRSSKTVDEANIRNFAAPILGFTHYCT